MKTAESREVKACEGCGFARKVRVTDYGPKSENYMLHGKHWSKLCGACTLVKKARAHRHAASIFEQRAVDIRSNRSRRQRRRRGGEEA